MSLYEYLHNELVAVPVLATSVPDLDNLNRGFVFNADPFQHSERDLNPSAFCSIKEVEVNSVLAGLENGLATILPIVPNCLHRWEFLRMHP